MSQLLRHDGLMVLFVRRTPFRADRRDSRDVQECGMCDLQCGTGISGKGCGISVDGRKTCRGLWGTTGGKKCPVCTPTQIEMRMLKTLQKLKGIKVISLGR